MKTNYPEEYETGWVEFYYQKFRINEHVLIPRLETESLVREIIRESRIRKPDILIDIGTGSGIIPLSVLSGIGIPRVFAVDISPEALAIAEGNGSAQGRDITFLRSDLLGAFLEEARFPTDQDIVIAANLPYIKEGDWENMSADTVHEPKMALFGWADTGFELYERLFPEIERFARIYRPKSLRVFAEMGEDQKEIARTVLENYGWDFSFFADLRGIERFLRIRIV